MHRNVRSTAGRSSVSKHTRRYGPHKISYKVLEEIKYYRECYLRVYKEDICDLEPFCLYKKFLEDESLFGKVNTDDEDDADDDDLAGEIHLKHVDLRIKQNAFDHHTDMFKCTSKRVYQGKDQPAALVIRRGQIFTIELNFDREYDATKHDLQLRFQTGLDPSHLRGTDVTIDMDEDGNKFTKSNNWQARVASAMPAQVLKIEVYPATKCPIGEWDMHVYTISKEKRGGEEKKLHYKHDEDIFILFNAWCKEDEVYFEVDPDFDTEVDPKKEYVLNPSGTVYRSGMWPKAWRFGQVNKVLVGRWDGEYDDGSTPGSWSGSVKILHQFRDKKMAVKYGQCWVFSGVTVTVCRALGIPCRSVTNYSSAHDTNFNCSIDRVTAFGEDDYMSKDGDSIWNFHVWNEIWTKRPDLQSSELDGWQVIDATPQELSGVAKQCADGANLVCSDRAGLHNEDEVYFEVDPDFDTEVDPKKEYVLNPSGTVYRSGMWPKAWRFGQFEEEILQICLLLVTRYFDGVVNSKMGLAWEVARAISSMVNKVLVGRWDGEYDDGSTPGSWSGSVKILHQFRDKKMAVKYGQCWVFSGVTVTVCRALGIPCRSVTNYSSAHDTNFNCSIDRVTAFGEDDYMSKDGDSIWNFHVWNEIWTKRPDLQSSELDGWQVIDATPQELSGGVYQCGPCPVKAVKHGLIYLPHDTVFVFGEVNCDVIYFEQRGQHTFKRMRTERDSVGKNISTKKPDGLGLTQDKIQQWLQRLDVTPLYKSKEKSADERLAVARAMRYAGNEIEEEAQEIDITIRPKKAETEMYLGADIPFVVYVKNVCEDKTNKLRISRLTVNLSSINYTGHKRNRVMKKEFSEFALNPDEERSFDVVVPWSDYKDKRKDSSDVSISAVATCLKSGNTFMENAVITLRNPEILEIKVKQGITKCKVDEDVELSISMKNVMPMQIGGIVVKFDTECFEDPDDIKIGTIGIDESFERTLKLKALRKGNGQIIVCVDSNNMPDMTDVVDIEVDDK